MREYMVKFYGSGRFVKYVYVYADSKVDAILKARKENEIVEVIFCQEVRRWSA